MRHTITRRNLLRMGAAGAVGSTFVGAAAHAESGQPSAPGLMRDIRAAAQEYGVPVAVLLAMGYVNTRLEMPPPSASDYQEGDPEGVGIYGLMALVRNPTADTVGEASRLTGIPVHRLISERAANLRGGAALLAESQGGAHPHRAHRAGDWLDAVAGAGGRGPTIRATAGVGGGEVYAEQLADVLRRGFSVQTSAGERVDLTRQEVD